VRFLGEELHLLRQRQEVKGRLGLLLLGSFLFLAVLFFLDLSVFLFVSLFLFFLLLLTSSPFE